MRKLILTILCGGFFFSLWCLPKQDVQFDYLTVEDELSQNTINTIFKDSRGFLWFGTNDGLNRYDGYSFKIYRHNTNDSNSISDNKIYAIVEDQSGDLWIGTRGGLNRLDRKRDRFIKYQYEENDPSSLSNDFVRCLYLDASGNIWIGTLGGGLCIYDQFTKKIKRIHSKCIGENCDEARFINVTSILEDEEGNLWIGTNSLGINQYFKENYTYLFYPFEVKTIIRPENSYGKNLYLDLQGKLWICSEGNGLFQFNIQTKEFQHYQYTTSKNSLSNNIVKDMLQVDKNLYWIATDGGGLNIFDASLNKFDVITYDINKPKTISSNAVFELYKDDENIFWIGTFGGGINILNTNKKPFRHYTEMSNDNNSLSHKSVLAFLEDDGGYIWIGTDGGGLNRFNPKTGRFKHFTHNPGDPKSISSNVVTSLYEDHQGKLWVGTYAGGLNLFNRKEDEFFRYQKDYADSSSLINNNVWSIVEDHNNHLWVGTLGGLDLFDRNNQTFLHFSSRDTLDSPLTERVTIVFEDSQGNIWIGGSGLSILNIESRTIIPVYNLKINNDVRDIFEDHDRNLWIGTEGGGLVLYNPVSGKIKNYTTSHGLPSNAVHAILQDRHQQLWLTTNHGVARFNCEENVFRNFDIRDGLQSNQFSYNAAIESKNGLFYMGGVNGFNVFHPDSIKDNQFIPPVVITDFTIMNRPVAIGSEDSPLKYHISETRSITLNHKQSVFTFEFKALGFTSPEKNQYRIKMEGFDQDWIFYGSRRYASYTNLPAGDYTFRVQASNNDGIWNEEGVSLDIKILPPPWKTVWAYLIYTLALISLFYSLRKFMLIRAHLKNDIKIKEMEKQKIEEINQMKLRFFTNISHEFRTPLTLILGPVQHLLETKKNDRLLKKQLSLIYRNAERLLRLINQLMDFRKVETGNMQLRASKGDIVTFVKGINQAFEGFAKNHRIDFQFNTDSENIMLWFDRDKIEIVLYNLLSNALKFTPDRGFIEVSLRNINKEQLNPESSLKSLKANEFVEISVRDSGIGISSERIHKIFERFYQIDKQNTLRKSIEQTGTGVGLALTKNLVEMHKGEIYAESEEGKGACFKIYLPKGKEHLNEDQLYDDTNIRDYSQINDHKVFLLDEEDSDNAPVHSVDEDDQDIKSKPLILVIEDNQDLRQYIRQILEEFYHVEIAENGIVGLELSRSLNPTLILTDILMPEMDGMELCKKLKSDLATSHIPIIMLTALNSTENKIESFEAGADDYISKPFSAKLLRVRVNNIILARQKLRERYRKDLLLEPKEVTVTSADEQFLKKAVSIVEEHISDPGFDVPKFVSMMNMSRSVLYRKLRAITDQSANEFVRLIRLKRAAQLLSTQELTVSEISYMVGFGDPQYFSKCFRRQYGKTPSEYAAEHTRESLESN